jgi:DNA-binding HxlR family transcriptional regulator
MSAGLGAVQRKIINVLTEAARDPRRWHTTTLNMARRIFGGAVLADKLAHARPTEAQRTSVSRALRTLRKAGRVERTDYAGTSHRQWRLAVTLSAVSA